MTRRSANARRRIVRDRHAMRAALRVLALGRAGQPRGECDDWLAAMMAEWGAPLLTPHPVQCSNSEIGTPLAAVDVRPLPADAADTAQSERPITPPA